VPKNGEARVTEKREREKTGHKNKTTKRKEHRILWCATVQHSAIAGNAAVCVLKLNQEVPVWRQDPLGGKNSSSFTLLQVFFLLL
jgi:hypothetical protein